MLDRIFVYGILLRDAHEAAILPGYRLGFDGFATVDEDEDGHVYGGVIYVDAEALRRFDFIEGVDRDDPSSEHGYYRRVRVILGDDEPAWVYRMNSERRVSPDPKLIATMAYQYERLGHRPDEVLALI